MDAFIEGRCYPQLDWLMRAFAQPAEVQFDLYQNSYACADDLATDYTTAIEAQNPDFLERNPEMRAFDELLDRKSGIEEHCTAETMLNVPYWEEIRECARYILIERGLPVTPPEPLNVTFVNVDEPGVPKPKKPFWYRIAKMLRFTAD